MWTNRQSSGIEERKNIYRAYVRVKNKNNDGRITFMYSYSYKLYRYNCAISAFKLRKQRKVFSFEEVYHVLGEVELIYMCGCIKERLINEIMSLNCPVYTLLSLMNTDWQWSHLLNNFFNTPKHDMNENKKEARTLEARTRYKLIVGYNVTRQLVALTTLSYTVSISIPWWNTFVYCICLWDESASPEWRNLSRHALFQLSHYGCISWLSSSLWRCSGQQPHCE